VYRPSRAEHTYAQSPLAQGSGGSESRWPFPKDQDVQFVQQIACNRLHGPGVRG
jgi:hypothetical protein